MTKSPIITADQLIAWRPCPRYSQEEIRARIPPAGATLRQILEYEIPAADKVWVATRPGVLSDRTLRLLAVDCARRRLSCLANPDPRGVAACDVAERFANGLATDEELKAAHAAAWAVWAAHAVWAEALPAQAEAEARRAEEAEYEAQVAWLLAHLESGEP